MSPFAFLFTNSSAPCGFVGNVLLSIGIAFLISYYVGKRMLAKEMEAEEQLLTAQAESK